MGFWSSSRPSPWRGKATTENRINYVMLLVVKKRERERERKPKLCWLSHFFMRHSPRHLYFLIPYGMCRFVHKKTKRLPNKGYTKSYICATKSTTKKATVLRRIFFCFFYSFCRVFITANTEWVFSFVLLRFFSKYNNKSEKELC